MGAVVAFALSRLGITWDASVTAYGSVVLVGVLTGLVAGRPIWGREAKLEVLLKSAVGAFIGCVALYGARKWLGSVHVDLGAYGRGAFGTVPAAALPAIGASLSIAFEIDDAVGPEATAGGPKRRVEASSGSPDPGEEHEEEAPRTERARHGSPRRED